MNHFIGVGHLSWAVSGVMLLVGCGESGMKTVPVRGTVLVDGVALHTGTVTFDPVEAGPAATGEIQPDGTFVMTTYEEGDGAVVGEHGVIVVAVDQGSFSGLPEDPVEPLLLVPRRYGSSETSGLSAVVKEGEENFFTFELEAE